MSENPRCVFFVSDGTGITAETLGRALMTQFRGLRILYITLPFVDSLAKADEVVAHIRRCIEHDQELPIVFSTLVEPELRDRVARAPCLFQDLMGTFLPGLEQTLGETAQVGVGRLHGTSDLPRYEARIEAINYTLAHDDGLGVQGYHQAAVILVGVSRTGKTPVSLYLALHYGVRAANFPLTEADLQRDGLPRALQAHRQRLYGLSIHPERLRTIREQRRPGTAYSSPHQVRRELQRADRLFRELDLPWCDTSALSVEEIASRIMASVELHHRAD